VEIIFLLSIVLYPIVLFVVVALMRWLVGGFSKNYHVINLLSVGLTTAIFLILSGPMWLPLGSYHIAAIQLIAGLIFFIFLESDSNIKLKRNFKSS